MNPRSKQLSLNSKNLNIRRQLHNNKEREMIPVHMKNHSIKKKMLNEVAEEVEVAEAIKEIEVAEVVMAEVGTAITSKEKIETIIIDKIIMKVKVVISNKRKKVAIEVAVVEVATEVETEVVVEITMVNSNNTELKQQAQMKVVQIKQETY